MHHPRPSLNDRLLFYQKLCLSDWPDGVKVGALPLLGERRAFSTFFLTGDKVLFALWLQWEASLKWCVPIVTTHCAARGNPAINSTWFPYQFTTAELTQTWWRLGGRGKSRKTDQARREVEERQWEGMLMIWKSFIMPMILITTYNCKKPCTCMASFIFFWITSPKSIYLVHLNYLIGSVGFCEFWIQSWASERLGLLLELLEKKYVLFPLGL